jgi:hypothetical protein
MSGVATARSRENVRYRANPGLIHPGDIARVK